MFHQQGHGYRQFNDLLHHCFVIFSLFLYLIVPGTCNCICVKSCTCVSTCMMGMFDHQGHGYRQFNDLLHHCFVIFFFISIFNCTWYV